MPILHLGLDFSAPRCKNAILDMRFAPWKNLTGIELLEKLTTFAEAIQSQMDLRREIMKEGYYHMFANGDDAKNFIINDEEFKAAFNRFAICSHLSGVVVVSASVEDTHPHALLWGTFPKCMDFKERYESISMRSIARRRGSNDGVNLHCELYEVNDEQYLKNVAVYTVIQATKDGKAVMPYDYRYGTAALYFRSKYAVLPWYVDDDGIVRKARTLSELTYRERKQLCGSQTFLPDNWQTCNGFLLPQNYVDIRRFESIYVTHNCFRAFMASGKARDEEIRRQMAGCRGVMFEDIEARKLCEEHCQLLFHRSSTRTLSSNERIYLAQQLRKTYHLSYRQLANLVKLKESELRIYVK